MSFYHDKQIEFTVQEWKMYRDSKEFTIVRRDRSKCGSYSRPAFLISFNRILNTKLQALGIKNNNKIILGQCS